MLFSAGSSDSVELSRPLVVAHRGARLTHPENTLGAFDAALAAGADAVELDVRLTSDGVVVVSHDADVGRMAGEQGFIHEMTLERIKALDASIGHGREGDQGGAAGAARTEIPTLREALSLVRGRGGVDIEIKNLPEDPDFDSPDEAVASEVVKVLDEFGMRGGDVLVTSFNWLSIERVRTLAPDVATGFLTSPAIDPRAALIYARQAGHAVVLPHAYALADAGAGFVTAAQDDGVRVWTWTVDEPEDMARFFEWGVEAVITNDPPAAVRARDAWRRGLKR
jgi:glycerophosphoryl diester phosphodiesterase